MKHDTYRSSLKYLVIPVLAGFAITPAYAGNNSNNGSNGAGNGQPFLALQAQIDANQAAIASNASDIADLNADITAINLQIADLENDMVDLQSQISANTAEIAELSSQVTTNAQDVRRLKLDLRRLEQEVLSVRVRNEREFERIGAEIARLDAEREALSASLESQLAQIQSQVDSNFFAIDGVLLDIVTINATLTVVNSNVLSLQMDLSNLEAEQAANSQAISDLSTIVSTLQDDVTALQALHGGGLFGIQTNFPESDLTDAGWTRCFSTSYRDNTPISTLLNQCSGAKIALACKPISSNTVHLAASANREDVFFNTGDRNNVVHNANGVDWYFSTSWSMGFAPEGQGVRRSSADVAGFRNNDRLSWHTWNGNMSSGYRCGNTYLNGNSTWEKVVYQSN